MRHVRFPLKVVTACFGEEKRFDYKKNHGYSKLSNFWLDNINISTTDACNLMIYLISIEVKKGPTSAESF